MHDDDGGDIKNDHDNASSKAFSQRYTGDLIAGFTLNLVVANSSATFVSALARPQGAVFRKTTVRICPKHFTGIPKVRGQGRYSRFSVP